MPFPTKVQPADSKVSSLRNDQGKTAGGGKSRLKRLFERQFQSVLRISSSEKLAHAGDGRGSDRDDGGGGDQDPNSVCLVFSFMEENNEKSSSAAARCGRRRCNCFNGNCDDSSDEDVGSDSPPIAVGCGETIETLRTLVLCPSITERNLLADVSKIVEKSRIFKAKADFRKIAAAGLRGLGYDASVCKSRWEKTPSFPAGEYEYVDVIVDAERYLLDVDFRSEFEIARSTKNYRAVLQQLPAIFVGKENRLHQIVALVSEASKQSLRKKGLHFPPWRKAEYMRAKWLSPYDRTTVSSTADESSSDAAAAATATAAEEDGKGFVAVNSSSSPISAMNFSAEFQIRPSGLSGNGEKGEKISVLVSPWQPPAVKPKVPPPAVGSKNVAGLASALREKPPSPIF